MLKERKSERMKCGKSERRRAIWKSETMKCGRVKE